MIGVASSQWTDDDLRRRARESLEDAGKKIDDDVFERLASRLCYVSGQYEDPTSIERVAGLAASPSSRWPTWRFPLRSSLWW